MRERSKQLMMKIRIQFNCSVMSDSLRSHERQHARPPCTSPTPGVHQTHVHRVSDAIQSSHPLSSPSPPALNLSSIRVFSNESALHIRWPKYWGFSFNISPSMNTQDWSPLGWTGWISLLSKGPSRSSPTPQFKSISSSAFSFLYSPTLTSIHNHWKNYSLD